MADIRTLTPTPVFASGRFIAQAAAPAGFTQGRRYYPIALGIDCAPAQPVVYTLVADDNGQLRPVQVAAFTWIFDSLDVGP